jgi:transposase
MSYVVEQKIRGHIYLYEVQAYWDSEKKQSRQKRRYLGKKDIASGELIPPRHQAQVIEEQAPPQVYDVGHLYLLKTLAQRCKLTSSLQMAFGAQSEVLLSLAYYQISESKAFHLYPHWQTECWPEGLAAMSSQRISDLLLRLSQQNGQINSFFKTFARQHGPLKGAWLDITSLSSYATTNSWVEWGYNRDGDDLPQVNLGILMGYPAHLPFFYQLYPGSIADVSTLHNVVLQAQDLEIPVDTWVMDRGFFSQHNICHMMEQSLSFVTAMPMRLNETKRLMSVSQASLRSPAHCFCLGKDVLFYNDTSCHVGTLALRACVYLNEKRRADEMANFIERLQSIENTIQNITFTDKDMIMEWLDQQWKGCETYFKVTLQKEGKALLKRKKKALSERMNLMGKMILLTNRKDLSPQELLKQYREKDRIEKVFDTLKNDIHEGRLRTHGTQRMQGKMFVTFLALILYSALSNTIQSHKLLQKYTVQEIMLELKKIRLFITKSAHKPLLSEISKKQRAILDAFNLNPNDLSLLNPGI